MWTKHVMTPVDEDIRQRVWAVQKLLLFFYIPLTVLSFAVAVLAIWVSGYTFGSPFLAAALLSLMVLILMSCAVATRSRPAILMAEVSLLLLLLVQAALAIAFVVVVTYFSTGILLLGFVDDDDDHEDNPEGLELWAKSLAILCVVVIATVVIFLPMMVTQLLLVWRLTSLREALTQMRTEGYMENPNGNVALEEQALLHPKQPDEFV
ncbi:hypothetical protein QOT17_021400 [Balamuthia mandrillaris]